MLYPKRAAHLLLQERLQASEEGFLEWLLPGKSRSVSLLAQATTEFSHFAFFVLASEEDRPASARAWKGLLTELGRGGEEHISLDDAAKRAAEALDVSQIDIASLPIYRCVGVCV